MSSGEITAEYPEFSYPELGDPAAVVGTLELAEEASAAVENDVDDHDDTDSYSPANDFILDLPLDEVVQRNLHQSIRDLEDWLAAGNFITGKNCPDTNIFELSAGKTYKIPDAAFGDFYRLLEAARRDGCILRFMEKQYVGGSSASIGGATSITHSGIMIDFDCYQKSPERVIGPIHYSAIARELTAILAKMTNLADYATGRACSFHMFFLRKPAVDAVNADGSVFPFKDGLHVLIPELMVTKSYKKYLLGELAGALPELFEDIQCDQSRLLDTGSSYVPVQLYGCARPNKRPHVLDQVLVINYYTRRGDIEVNVVDQATLTNRNLCYELSLAHARAAIGDAPTWLGKRKISARAEIEKTFVEDNDQVDTIDMITVGNTDAKQLRQLLQALPDTYANDYGKWRGVLCVIAHASPAFKPLAAEFSARSPKFDRAYFESTWAGIISKKVANPLTVASLRRWVRLESPEKYANIQQCNGEYLIEHEAYTSDGDVSHAALARVLHLLVGDKYIVDYGISQHTGKSGYLWYEFVTAPKPGVTGHMKKGEIYKWREEPNPDNLHTYISDMMLSMYKQCEKRIRQRKEAGGKYEKHWKNVEKGFKASKKQLGNDRYQTSVITQAKYRFRVRGFCDELDADEYLLGVGNGVLKLGAAPQLIRGYHDYKISKYTPVDYVPYDPTNPIVQRLLAVIRDIYPEDDMFHWKLLHASTNLDQRMSANMLLFQYGLGSNGKTLIEIAINEMLGKDYSDVGHPALLVTHGERASDANSAQMQMKGKRHFYFDEFKKSSLLNTATLKKILNPKQSGRQLYGQQHSFRSTANMVVLTNFPLLIDCFDHGTWRRIKFYYHSVKFTEKPDPAKITEKKADASLEECIKTIPYKQALLSILVHYYSRLCTEYSGDIRKVPCRTLEIHTERYRNTQDHLNRFICNMIVMDTANPSAVVSMTDLYDRYTVWYDKHVGRACGQTMDDFKELFSNSRLEKHLTVFSNGSFNLVGFRLKYSAEEELRSGEIALTAEHKN
jgi:phage/plasmid-associated DNA primase